MKHKLLSSSRLNIPICIDVSDLTSKEKASLQLELFKVGVVWGSGSAEIFEKGTEDGIYYYIIEPNRRLYHSGIFVGSSIRRAFSPIEAINSLRYRIWLLDEDE